MPKKNNPVTSNIYNVMLSQDVAFLQSCLWNRNMLITSSHATFSESTNQDQDKQKHRKHMVGFSYQEVSIQSS